MSFNEYKAQANKRPDKTVLDFSDNRETNDEEKSIRESLLRESGHLTNSEQLLDEQFELAVKTREDLRNQRWTIKSMQSQYNDLTSRFHIVNTLIRRIRARKRRDTIILALVVCICLGFLLYNIF